MAVHRSRTRGLVAPGAGDELLALEHAALVLEERPQQNELTQRQMQPPPVEGNRSGIGIDLERAEIRHIDLRQGDVYSPPFDGDSFDLIVVHQVLHFLDDAGRALREAARLLTPGGRLLIVDFAPHALEFMRTEHAHHHLGLRGDSVIWWLEQAGLDLADSRTIDPPDAGDDGERLTVTLWLASDPRVPTDATAAARIAGSRA